MQTKKGRKITSALRGQYKNQHMLAGSACSVLSIIIFVIIITTERELDQDTCGEGVETAERERENKKKKKKTPLCLCDDVSVCMCICCDSGMSERQKLNQMITHQHLAVSNEFDFEARGVPAALFNVGHVS